MEHLGEEELDEVVVAAVEPVVAVVLRPALAWSPGGRRRWRARPGPAAATTRTAARSRPRPAPARGARRPPGRPMRRRWKSPTSTARSAPTASMTATVSAAYSALAYAAAPDGSARPAAAAPVEGDHAVVAGEVRHLRLPHPRPHDRPGGQQHHGGRPGPVHGELEPGAASHHDVLAHRTGPGRPRHGRTSNTLLNGVDAASRKLRKPAATVTSRIRAGPAWVPSAAPTGCDSEAGVQSRVEKP